MHTKSLLHSSYTTMLSTRYPSRLPLRLPCMLPRMCPRAYTGVPGSSSVRTTKQLNETLDELQSGQQKIAGEQSVMKDKLQVVDERFGVLTDKIVYALQHLDDRMTTLEKRMDDRLTTLEKRMTHKMASVKTRLTIKMNNMIWQNGMMMAGLIVLMVLGGTDAGRHLLQLVIGLCARVPA